MIFSNWPTSVINYSVKFYSKKKAVLLKQPLYKIYNNSYLADIHQSAELTVIPEGTFSVLYKRSSVQYGNLTGTVAPAVGTRTGQPVLL